MIINIKKLLIIASILVSSNTIIADDSEELNTATHGNQGQYPEAIEERRFNEIGSLTNNRGITLETDSAKKYDKIWQAAVETVDFAPISTANDGVIVTDWYNIDGKSNEQFKMTINVVKNSNDVVIKVFSKDKKTNLEKTNTIQTNKIATDIKAKILAKVAIK